MRATALTAFTVPREQPAAVLVGGAHAPRSEAACLLDAAGFSVEADDAGAGAVAVVFAGPDAAALRAIPEIAERLSGTPIVAVMPPQASGSVLRRALRAGAMGIVLEDRLAGALVPTVGAVVAGQLAVPPTLRRQLAPRPLSHREKQILGLVVLGYTNRQIADRLFVAESTVKTHLSSAFEKLDARSRSEAAALIVDPQEGYGLGILAISQAEDPAPAAR